LLAPVPTCFGAMVFSSRAGPDLNIVIVTNRQGGEQLSGAAGEADKETKLGIWANVL
jgi:hypothetical protein